MSTRENMIKHLTLEELGRSLEDGDILVGDVIVVIDAPEPMDYVPEEELNKPEIEIEPAMAR